MSLRWVFFAGACLLALIGTATFPSYQTFTAGPPLLSAGPHQVSIGTRAGLFSVAKGQHYVVQLQGASQATFLVGFLYEDGTRSRSLRVYDTSLGAGRIFAAVIKPERDAVGTTLEFLPDGTQNDPSIEVSRLSVERLTNAYYIWRTVMAVGRLLLWLGFATACLQLLWPGHRRHVAGTQSPSKDSSGVAPRRSGTPDSRGLIFWTVLLLLMSGMLMPFFLQSRYSPLLCQSNYLPAIEGWDDSFYFFWLRSVMVHGDVDFAKDLVECDSLDLAARQRVLAQTPRTAAGLLPNKYPIGWALVEVPWYGVATVLAHAANLLGAHVRYDGWNPLYQGTLIFGQVVYAVAGLYFASRFVAHYVPGAVALCGVLLAWLGSALFYYQTQDLSMSHNTMFFSVAGVYLLTLRLRKHPASTWNWALVGAFSALVILARYQGAVLLLFPGIVCLRLLAANFRSMALRFLTAVVAGALPLALQVAAWKFVFGSFFVYTYTGETFSWTRPHWSESLFSPFHGLFYWHPVMLAALAGFVWWALRTAHRIDALCFAVSLMLLLYVNAAWDCWWFGAAFGARAFDGCLLFAMLGVAALLERSMRWRQAIFHAVAATLLIADLWNMNLVWLVNEGKLPLERPVLWAEMADQSLGYWTRNH